MREEAPIQVRGLTKAYGRVQAVRGVDFCVYEGEVFALLGPNGAGKTTTVEILEGLRERTAGEVRVLGYDPQQQSLHLKDRIGVCLQFTNLPSKIRVWEALHLFSALYSKAVEPASLLQRLQLEEKREAFYADLSGGQKQRLVLALALINDPQILFLDEPTAGLDPQARHEIHDLVEDLKREGRTILLTTHYIEEAEKLCDRLAIIDHGKIIAMGTPEEIRSKTLGHSVIEVRIDRPLPAEVPSWQGAEKVEMGEGGEQITVTSRTPARTLVEMIRWLEQAEVELEDVHLKRPSLEDVFIELTGRSLRE